jgi:hypothetical protein
VAPAGIGPDLLAGVPGLRALVARAAVRSALLEHAGGSRAGRSGRPHTGCRAPADRHRAARAAAAGAVRPAAAPALPARAQPPRCARHPLPPPAGRGGGRSGGRPRRGGRRSGSRRRGGRRAAPGPGRRLRPAGARGGRGAGRTRATLAALAAPAGPRAATAARHRAEQGRPEVARAVHGELAAGFVPEAAPVPALQLWRYLGGPWEPVSRHPFAAPGEGGRGIGSGPLRTRSESVFLLPVRRCGVPAHPDRGVWPSGEVGARNPVCAASAR